MRKLKFKSYPTQGPGSSDFVVMKSYQAPRLTEHGNLQDLTLGEGNRGSDDAETSSYFGSKSIIDGPIPPDILP